MQAKSLRKLAFLSNGMTSALELDGDIIWFPCPRFDSPTVFCSILDAKKGGHFSIRPEGKYEVKSEYVGNSLVLKNTFHTDAGDLVVKDFVPLGSPSIMRIFESAVPFVVDIDPRFMYGKEIPRAMQTNQGIIFKVASQADFLDVVIEGKYEIVGESSLKFAPGNGFIVASYSEYERYKVFGSNDTLYVNPARSLEMTLEYFKESLFGCREVGDFKDAYYRSILVMLGLLYRSSGGIIAAATTSMPPVIGGPNNWDYRYVWVRDSAYAVEAFSSCSMLSEARKVLDFLISNIDGSSKGFIHPVYTVDGLEVPLEHKLDWLSGYMDSAPVRVGNAAYIQMQRDCEGDFVNAFYKYIMNSNDLAYLRENMWAIDALAEWSRKSWQEKSLSMWEERLEQKHFVQTKLMDWVVLDRAGRLHALLGNKDRAKEYAVAAEAIKNDIMRNGVSPKGYFVKHYGSEEVDASLLLLTLYDFVDSKSEVFAKTLSTIEERLLTKDGVLLRNEHDFEGDNSNPFTLVNTWLARVYVRRGEPQKAKEMIANLVTHSNDLLLLGERVDPKGSEPSGNFPQLFPHSGLVEAIIEYSIGPGAVSP